MPKATNRQFLAPAHKNNSIVKLDLLGIQKESWNWFLTQGVKEILQEISPIDDFTGKNWQLTFGDLKLLEPQLTPREAQEKGLTYSTPLMVKTSLLNKKTGKVKEQEVFLGDIPQMTTQGTFIVNGIPRVVVNQLVRSPGVYFLGDEDPSTGRMLHRAEIRPVRGSWLEFEVTKNEIIIARIDRRRRVPATTILRAFGLSTDEQILESFANLGEANKYIQQTLEKDTTKNQDEALIEVYKRMRPGEPAVLETARTFFTNLFLSARRYELSKVGRFKINKRLNLSLDNSSENWVLTQQDIVATLTYLVKLQTGLGTIDDIDNLSNRRLRRVGELVGTQAFRIGLLRLERAVKERMSLASTDDDISPSLFVNARPVIAAINEFFRSNQLSTILDQTNLLSELDNLRRVTVTGPGGISRERASFSIRDINASQYGRIDPVRSPEGPNIGLVTYLSLFARVNEYGFLETPYRKIERDNNEKMKVTSEIVYLSADDEADYHITDAGIHTDSNGYIIDSWVPVRYKGEFSEGPVETVDFVDLSPQQVVGTSASLIPFLSNDEANRALMGTHMQCQAVPLIAPSSPVVGTGMEETVAQALGWVIRAQNSGTVTYVDAQTIEVTLDKSKKDIESFPVVPDTVKRVGNERQGYKDVYKLITFKRTTQSTCYHQKARVIVGQMVKAGDILADGPSTELGELALGQNLTIAYCSFEGLGYEDAIIISDRLTKEDSLTSIHIEEYESSVVDTKLGPEEVTRDIPNVGESDLADLDEGGIIVVGAEVGPNDILVGKIQPKGETELSAEERLLRAIFGEKARDVRDTSLRVPHGERGTVIEVKIFDRDKGDDLEPGTLKRVVVRVAQIRKVTAGDKLAGRHGNKGVISKIVPAADMPYLPNGTPVDIIISPLSVIARMNLGQLLEVHLGWAFSTKGKEKVAVPVFEKVDPNLIEESLKEAGLPVSGKVRLTDGRTGQEFEQETVVGTTYIMKLIHMVEDKTHARSTGPYSLVTQQPLGGKAQMGGQRLGEMEVWALEAHRAAHTLQEMLTIKSDDVAGRARAFEAIVKGTEISEPTVPESFRVLVRELNSLCIDVQPRGEIIAKSQDLEEESPLAQELAQASGSSVATELGGKEN